MTTPRGCHHLPDEFVREEQAGEFGVRVAIEGTRARAVVVDADGTTIENPPPKWKRAHKALWKEMQASAREVARELTIYRERLERGYLAEAPVRPEHFRDFHLAHPVARRFAAGLIWIDDRGRSFLGRREEMPDGAGWIRLWHPAQDTPEGIASWRRRILEERIAQPFKQAFRELYVITPAEVHTRTYSIRYAGHVLRARPFTGLRHVRGWGGSPLRAFEGNQVPQTHLVLRRRDQLRAALWFDWWEPTRGEAESRTMADHVVLDRIRFEVKKEGSWTRVVPLEEVDPLLFSEVMRDVDLFVSVSGVDRDPSWEDAGPGGRRMMEHYRRVGATHWSPAAEERRRLLIDLVGQLRLERVVITERHVLVQGKRSRYRVHIGSGDIALDPTGSPLCIVPRGVVEPRVFLPFEEEDVQLNEILSKILFLLNDDRIRDPWVLSRIEKG